jgi:hypothetical protein
MNRVSTLLITLLLIMGIAIVPPAKAQTDILIGPRLGLPLGDMSDLQATLLIGAGARIVTESLPVVLNPSFDFYLFDSPEGADQTGFALDLNALYDFEIENEVFKPYAGGVGITRYSASFRSSDFGGFGFSSGTTEVGLNLVGGVRFMLDAVSPFVQLNATVGGDISRLGLAGGVFFSF